MAFSLCLCYFYVVLLFRKTIKNYVKTMKPIAPKPLHLQWSNFESFPSTYLFCKFLRIYLCQCTELIVNFNEFKTDSPKIWFVENTLKNPAYGRH